MILSAAHSRDGLAAVCVAGALVLASAVGFVLKRLATSESAKRTIANLNARVAAWWLMAAVFAGAIALGPGGATVLFAIISFLAMREMLTLAPTRRADHHTLFWTFFVILPIQYYLVYIHWYGLFAIFIPVYCYIFVAIRGTLTGDVRRYLERTAKIQWGLFICVYCISYAPALLSLDISHGAGQSWELLVWLVIIAQMSDVLQYCWGKLLGRHNIAPHISPGKTWEGFIGGALSAIALAELLRGLTPFDAIQAALLGGIVILLGFFGGIVMSAIKRDAGIKDYGHLIAGHGGMMDRIDSLVFSAPILFHIVRYWYAIG